MRINALCGHFEGTCIVYTLVLNNDVGNITPGNTEWIFALVREFVDELNVENAWEYSVRVFFLPGWAAWHLRQYDEIECVYNWHNIVKFMLPQRLL